MDGHPGECNAAIDREKLAEPKPRLAARWRAGAEAIAAISDAAPLLRRPEDPSGPSARLFPWHHGRVKTELHIP
jgi:hypothetical protein